MNEQENINYNRVATAIEYLKQNFIEQPTLDDIAKQINLSPFHFQRLFTEWAGVSPKKFLQYISVQHAKQILTDSQSTLFETAHETGLSGTSRLHDLFVNIEGMTPGEYKNKGKQLTINYSFATSLFGEIMVASTEKGICYMGFKDSTDSRDDESTTFAELENRFPNATFIQKSDELQQNVLQIFSKDWSKLKSVKLHLKGTDFQLKVWEALLKLPSGNLASYGNVAKLINQPKASRAVGTAIGSNPVAFLIPCHRVIQSSGLLGGYMWGTTRKSAIIAWEASQIELSNTTGL